MWNEYPWDEEQKIKDLIAQTYKMKSEQILLGFGADELTNLLFMLNFLQGDSFPEITIHDFSYPMLRDYIIRYRYIISDKSDLEHHTIKDLETFNQATINSGSKNLWLDCTHIIHTPLFQKVILEIDSNLQKEKQKILIGSFSKHPFNLPGLRLGFLYSDTKTIQELQEFRSGCSIHGQTYSILKEKINEINKKSR